MLDPPRLIDAPIRSRPGGVHHHAVDHREDVLGSSADVASSLKLFCERLRIHARLAFDRWKRQFCRPCMLFQPLHDVKAFAALATMRGQRVVCGVIGDSECQCHGSNRAVVLLSGPGAQASASVGWCVLELRFVGFGGQNEPL